jgi:uncharacterized membrane protein YcgQ (UPF0703/DUF1980 family)
VSGRVRGGTLELSRFMATCCAADAVPYSIKVKLPEGSDSYDENKWLRVRGKVGPGRKTVVASSVEEIDQPLDAYG